MLTFETKTEEAKHYILEFMSDKELHFRSEILQFVKEKTDGSFTPTFISNCLSKLQKAGKLEIPERGVYILANLHDLDSHSNQNNDNNQNDSNNDSINLTLDSTIKSKQESQTEGTLEISATKEASHEEYLPEPILVPVTDLDKNCTDILDRAVLLLTAEARSIDVLNMTDTDYRSIRGIKESIKQLEGLKTYFK